MSVAQQIRSFSPNGRRILVSTFCAGLGSSGFALLFNLYLLALGYHADFIGLVASVTTLSTAVAGPVTFFLSRRIPLGRILTLGFLCQALGGTGQALMAEAAGILVFAVVFGLSQGFYWAPLPPFLAENSRTVERNHLFSLNIAVQLLAGILGYLGAGQAPGLLVTLLPLDAVGSLRTTLLIASGAAALSLIPMSRVGPPLPQRDHAHAVGGGTEAADGGRRHVIALGISALVMGLATGLAFPFFNVYFVAQQGATAETVGRIFALSAVISTGAVLMAPGLANRIGYVLAIVLSRLVGGIAMGALALSSSLGMAVAFFWLRNIALQIMGPLIDAFGMATVPPHRRAVQASVSSTLWHAGYAFASILSGLAIVSYGFAPSFLLASAVVVANSAVFWLYYRGWRPSGARA